MSCRDVRDWLVERAGAPSADVTTHLRECAPCARFADRRRVAGDLLRAHHGRVEPPEHFVTRVQAQLAVAAASPVGWAALRVLPATVALLLVLAWLSWQATPTPSALLEESPLDDVMTWVLEREEGWAVNRTVALIAVFALFVIGVGVGMLATHIFYARELGRFDGAPGFGPRPFVTQLEHELDLSPEQRRRIEEIREESRIEADALHEELAPRVRAHMRRTAELIREVLTPEQRLEFDELQRRHRERAEEFFLDGGPRHRPPPPPRRPPPPPRRPPPRPPSG